MFIQIKRSEIMKTNIKLLSEYADANDLEISIFADDSGALIINYEKQDQILLVNLDNSVSKLDIELVEQYDASRNLTISRVIDDNFSLYILNDRESRGTYTSLENAREAFFDRHPRYRFEEGGAIITENQESITQKRIFEHCKSCGARGVSGKYPFSTLAGSGYCDDCC